MLPRAGPVAHLPAAPARRFHQPAGLHVLGQSRDAEHHDDVVGASGMRLRSFVKWER
jgi:hypothetical protein